MARWLAGRLALSNQLIGWMDGCAGRLAERRAVDFCVDFFLVSFSMVKKNPRQIRAEIRAQKYNHLCKNPRGNPRENPRKNPRENPRKNPRKNPRTETRAQKSAHWPPHAKVRPPSGEGGSGIQVPFPGRAMKYVSPLPHRLFAPWAWRDLPHRQLPLQPPSRPSAGAPSPGP